MHSTIISPTEARSLPAGTLFFDCRHNLFNLSEGAEDYTKNHLPGAYHLHLDKDLSGPIAPGKTGRHPLPEMEMFAKFISSFDLKEGVQVVCYDDKGGGLAARLWWMLRALSHKKVAVLDGGIQAWTAAGFPLETGYRDHPVMKGGTAAPHLVPYSPLCTRDRAQIKALRKAPEYALIDSRTAPRYRGEEEPIDPVAGHIEGAVNLPWPDNLTEGKFKTKAELKARFAELKTDADRNVFYCGSGVTACHNILAYTYACGEVPLLYPGSWSEWITGE